MKMRLGIGMGIATLVIGAGAIALAQPEGKEEKGDEVVIKLSEAPEAVRTALTKITAADKVTKVIKEQEDGATCYEVEFTDGGMECATVLSGSGDVMAIERGLKESALPAAATAALKKAFPSGTFSKAESLQEFYYEVVVKVDGKSHGVKVNAAGGIENEGKKEAGEKGEKGEKHEGKKGEKDEDDDKD